MTTLFACSLPISIVAFVYQRRVPARPTSSVPSRTKLGAEACPPRLRLFSATLLGALLLAAAPAAATEPFRLVAMGDIPYRTPEDYAPFGRLIGAVNAARPHLVIHVGDLKGGSTPCTDGAFARMRDFFDTVEAPTLYTPGDNDWTDCHRAGMDPIERLAALRRLFFAAPHSLGSRPVPVTRQPDAGGSPYPENALVTMAGVTVIAAHVVGSNNNLRLRDPQAVAEHAARDRATSDWIRAGFGAARAAGSRAVVLAMHADPFAQGDGLPAASNRSGFAGTLTAIADGAARYAGPVLVIHGDGHRYVFDRPFRDAAGRRLAHVARLEVFGYPTMAAVEVTVTADRGRPFRLRTLASLEESGADLR